MARSRPVPFHSVQLDPYRRMIRHVPPCLLVREPERGGKLVDAGARDRQLVLERHPDVVVKVREAAIDRR